MIYFFQILSFVQKNGKSWPMNYLTTFGGLLIALQLYVVFTFQNL